MRRRNRHKVLTRSRPYFYHRVMPPKPCNESSITQGEQIVMDPGFETFVALTGRSEVPYRTLISGTQSFFADQLQYEDLSFPAWKPGQWSSLGTGWDVLSDGGADTGTYYAHWSGSDSGADLSLDQCRMCSNFRSAEPGSNPVDIEPWLHAGRVESGQTVDVTIRAKGSGGGLLNSDIEFWRPDGSFQNEADPIFEQFTMPGSTWTTFNHSGTVGGSTEPFWFMTWWVRRSGTGAATLSIDNVQISVT